MGTIAGHLLPGTIFTSIGMMLTIKYILYYFRMKLKGSSVMRKGGHISANQKNVEQSAINSDGEVKIRINSSKLSSDDNESMLHSQSHGLVDDSSIVKFGRFESWTFVVMILIGAIVETVTGLTTGHFEGHALQHMTIYMGYISVPIYHILMNKKCNGSGGSKNSYVNDPLFRGLDMWLLAIGYAIESILFAWHLHGRTPLDAQAHTFLLYCSVISMVFCILLATGDPADVKFRIMLAGSMILQGIWVTLTGIILYPADYMVHLDQTTHHSSMIVTAMFAWTIMSVIVIQFGVYKFLSNRFYIN